MRIGIFICHCGKNIKGSVDVNALAEYFRDFPYVFSSLDYPFLCSDPGQDLIRRVVREKNLDRVLIAACTGSLHTELFRGLLKSSGLNPYMLKRVSIREHCSWTGEDPVKNTEKAKSLITSGIFSLYHMVPLEERRMEVEKSALIIGAGVSGLSAASFLSRVGIKVYLVEKEREIGGMLREIKRIWPSDISGEELLRNLQRRLNREYVELFTSSEVLSVSGHFGNFLVTIACDHGEREIRVGGIIVASGFRPFDPKEKPELYYGRDRRILSTLDFERGIFDPKEEGPLRVAILHCIGSRDEQLGRPYCSRICCINALKVAKRIKEMNPESYVECFYMDLRSHPRGGEEFYEDVQESKVIFTRSNVAEILPKEEGILIRGEDTLSNEIFEREFDFVFLSLGICGPEDGRKLSTVLKIPLDKDGFFLEAHPKLRPFETVRKGILIAGCCSGPKDVGESIAHGRASAARLFQLLSMGYAEIEPFLAEINQKRCSGCRMCEAACPSNAIIFDQESRKVNVSEAQCMGCGLCASTCPSSAISLKGFSDPILLDEARGLLL